MDPDKACEHNNFHSVVHINRLSAKEGEPINAYSAEVHIHCAECNEVFRFIGMPAGLSGARPMCNIDETWANLPIRPASSDPDFGLGIPGYAIHMNDGI